MLLGSAAAQDDDRPRVYSFQGDVELRELLEFSVGLLEIHLEYDPGAIDGRVATRARPYFVRDLWDLANRELAKRGLTTVQPPGAESLRVVQLSSAMSEARLEQGDGREALAGYVKVLVGLQEAEPGDLEPTLQQLLSETGTVSVVRDTAALVLADFRPHVEQALDAIALLDAPQAAPVVEEVRLTETSPMAVTALLERVSGSYRAVVGEDPVGKPLALPEAQSILIVAPEDELVWWRELIQRFDRPEAAVMRQYVPRRFGLGETGRLVEEVVRGSAEVDASWRMVSDELTGTLYVTTTPSQHSEIESLLERLDAVEPGARRTIRTFEVHNRRVEEVLDLLQRLLDEGALSQPLGAPLVGSEEQEGATGLLQDQTRAAVALSQSEASVTLTADEGTNRIIAYGEPFLLEQIEALLGELDRRHGRLVVEATVVSLTETQMQDLGVEIRRLTVDGDTQLELASLFGLGAVDPLSSTLPPPMGAGFSGAVLDPGEWSALVRALETVNEGRTLTRPKVVVNNNQEANLDSVVQTPYSATNASNTVATTSLGGTVDAGTTIRVKPQVADGELVVLDYSVSISSFVGEAPDPNLPPPRQENRLDSVVTVPDGWTVVVGGLEIETEAEAASQIPVLGSIPLLGALFRNESTSESRSRFFVFLQATELRGDRFEQLKWISEEDREAAGVPDDWPVLEPRIMR